MRKFAVMQLEVARLVLVRGLGEGRKVRQKLDCGGMLEAPKSSLKEDPRKERKGEKVSYD